MKNVKNDLNGKKLWHLTLDELVSATDGRLARAAASEFSGVGTDTRKDLSGKVFFALKGEAHDAHRFLQKATEANAAAIVAHDEKSVEALLKTSPHVAEQTSVVLVEDTLLALQSLATFWRHKMDAQILAVTGTNGKTTTKEFAAAILKKYMPTQWSRGSFNNHWGAPLSLLSIDFSHKAALIEMGMNHAGEISRLVDIADPDVVGCTMVGRGHLEGLGSIENVARAKAEIYERSRPDAVAVFNLDNPYTAKMAAEARARNKNQKTFTFKTKTDEPLPAGSVKPDVSLRVDRASETSLTVSGEIAGVRGSAEAEVFGSHNVVNIMAASCFALAAGLTGKQIWKAIPECKTVWGRNQWVDLKSGARALFDAYNANPESMQAAIDNFVQLKAAGRKFAVLGEMREMGAQTEQVHEELGRKVAKAGFAAVLFLGASKSAFEAGMKAGGFQNRLIVSTGYENGLAVELASMLNSTDCVLFKGSRGTFLEKVLAEFEPLNFASKG